MATVTTKGDLVLVALRKAGLASRSTLVQPEPEMVEDALTDLELMIAEWENKGIRLGYQFADEQLGADTGDDHGLLQGDINSVALCLAQRILTDVNRVVPQSLATQARDAYEAMLYRQVEIPTLQRRNDMPVGQGNKGWGSFDRFYVEPDPLTTGDGTPITQ